MLYIYFDYLALLYLPEPASHLCPEQWWQPPFAQFDLQGSPPVLLKIKDIFFFVSVTVSQFLSAVYGK